MRAALRRQPQRDSTQTITLPAPVLGVTTLSPGSQMPEGKCVAAYNLIPGDFGLRSRLGSREWVTGMDGPVRSSLPFAGSTASNNRLFKTTSTGIWDCSSSTAAPTQVLVFASGAGAAGYGVCHAAVNAAGQHFLLYTDEVNGYHVYAEGTGTWTKVAQGAGAGQINGVDPARFVFVAGWGNRIYFVERDTAAAWYLDINAIYGTANRFNFASKFRAGGYLVGLWNWTSGDGGSGGLSDRLVAISSGGDVVIYDGYDPADASKISIAGVWSVGAIPAGRTIATPFGGDLLILSTLGVVPASRLTSGRLLEPTQYATADITNLFNTLATTKRNLRGWALTVHPEDNALVLLVPQGEDQACIPLVMSFATRGWFAYRDLPMTCAAPWDGKLYFGTPDGRCLVNDGQVDGVTLADPASYVPVQCSLLTAFSDAASPRKKRVLFIQPLFRSEGAPPTHRCSARFDWDTSEIGQVADAPKAGGVSEWDSALWDRATWSGDPKASSPISGASGMGKDVAIVCRFTAKSRVTLISIDVTLDAGGLF